MLLKDFVAFYRSKYDSTLYIDKLHVDMCRFHSQFNNAQAVIPVHRDMQTVIAKPFDKILNPPLNDIIAMMVQLSNEQLVQFYVEACLAWDAGDAGGSITIGSTTKFSNSNPYDCTPYRYFCRSSDVQRFRIKSHGYKTLTVYMFKLRHPIQFTQWASNYLDQVTNYMPMFQYFKKITRFETLYNPRLIRRT